MQQLDGATRGGHSLQLVHRGILALCANRSGTPMRRGARMKIVPSVHDRRLASDRRRGGSSIWASWMRQVDMVTAAEVWELVHEQWIPVKRTTRRLGAPISTLYEFLAAGKAARDNASHRAAALLSTAAKSPPLVDDDVMELTRRGSWIRAFQRRSSVSGWGARKVACDRASGPRKHQALEIAATKTLPSMRRTLCGHSAF
jgi:hypothetical protein